jgi:UDP-sulfoquinovose synthase
MKETIIVLGGDGYYGWPIALKLAVTRPETKIIIVDNEWRRNTVCKVGSDSLLPIARLSKRIDAYKEVYGRNNLHQIHMDVNSDALEELIRSEQPHTIYHMAQQCSAPYSMLGLTESLYTINNNEGNNMRLLWAVRKHVPDAHIIKMGSMGEYATSGGIDIAEGYFYPEFNGKKAVSPLPFPRQSDDVYHISKINDSNYLSMACRKWGLRITEVMQSTLFGVYTDEMVNCEDLYTRFDYDDIFGTVVNRFLTQAVAGHPLTVYGKGNQTTGIMPMKDAVNSLELIAGDVPAPGVHKVVNHVTKANCTINELAESVKSLAENLGYDVTINHVFDPRSESDAVKHDIKVIADHVDNNCTTTAFIDVLQETFGIIAKHKDRIHSNVFTHHIHAFRGKYTDETVAEEKDTVTEEQEWKAFREEYFNTERINLNPGTLGTTSLPVRNVRQSTAITSAIQGNPLGMYEHGRKSLAEIKSLCNELWPSAGYELVVASGTSQTINLLALAMLRSLNKDAKAPFRVVTSTHEHPGGIGVFEQLPEYEVHYISDEVLNDEEKLKAYVAALQPHVAFISQVYYASGNFSAYELFNNVVKQTTPSCKIILDVTQAIGLHEVPFGAADVLIGSLHKWLFGPHGSGVTWMKQDFHQWLGGLFWNGMNLSTEQHLGNITLQGGQDFIMYSEVLEALKLYKKIGRDVILKRSSHLSDLFKADIKEVFSKFSIKHKILNTGAQAPLLSVALSDFHPFDLYSELNEHGVHCKCIIDYKKDGEKIHILRFGFPYYETTERLKQAISIIEEIVERQLKVVQLQTITETVIETEIESIPQQSEQLSVAA